MGSVAEVADRSTATEGDASLGRSPIREIVLLASLYVFYCLSRVVGGQDLPRAQERAEDLVRLEDALHLDIEKPLNEAITHVAWLAVPMDYWYAVLHFVVTPLTLAWLYRKDRGRYAASRNALVVASLLGLLGYLFFPTAPPRLMGGTYVDTLAMYAHLGWWSEHASAPAGLGGLTNELAAMPSLHVGWAVWVAWALYRRAGRRGRAVLLAYPAGTTLVVIGTANHWVLDCVLGVAVVMAGVGVSSVLERRTWQTSDRSRPLVSLRLRAAGPAARREESR